METKDIKDIKFSTKSIMLTDKQEETISDLIDQLNDCGEDAYNNIEYWKLSKQDASKLISELIDRLQSYQDYAFEA